MTLRELQYLIALADLRHFGKAAEACFVSQPSLSMQIKKLEDNLGVQLLERTNKSVLLTPIGRIIVERARELLKQTKDIQALAQMAKDPYQGECHLGVIPTLAPYLLPKIIPPLAKKFPQLSFYLREEQTALLLEKLKEGKLDAAFLALPLSDPHLSVSPLFEEEFLLAVAADHPLSQRKSIRSADLEGKEIFLLEEGHCMREQTLALCHRVYASESQHFQATSLETLRQMVIAKVGMTLMPQLACQPNPDIAYIPFAGADKPRRMVGLCWRQSSAKQLLLEDLTAQIRKFLAKSSAFLKMKTVA